MKSLKLRKWVKVILSIILITILLTIALKIINNRFEQIENGNIKVINESQMAERN